MSNEEIARIIGQQALVFARTANDSNCENQKQAQKALDKLSRQSKRGAVNCGAPVLNVECKCSECIGPGGCSSECEETQCP